MGLAWNNLSAQIAHKFTSLTLNFCFERSLKFQAYHLI